MKWANKANALGQKKAPPIKITKEVALLIYIILCSIA